MWFVVGEEGEVEDPRVGRGGRGGEVVGLSGDKTKEKNEPVC